MAETVSKVDPQVRTQNFARQTRQNYLALPPQTVNENGTVQIELPHTRLLAKTKLLIQGQVTVAHAGNVTFVPAAFAPFNFIRSIRFDAQNTFAPNNLSGQGIAVANMIYDKSFILQPDFPVIAAASALSRARTVLGTEASVAGAVNTLRMVVDIGATLNRRDPVGLVLLQNRETTVTITIDMNDADVLLNAPAGYTVTPGTLTVTPMIEVFSIPALKDAVPDVSVLSIKGEKTMTIAGAGVFEFPIPVGLTYRKLAFYITAAGVGVFDGAITGQFELVLNQADVPYRISPWHLSAINCEDYGRVLPNGLWVFDFTAGSGMTNYAGTRDYIRTEQLTDFMFRFNATGAGNITCVYDAMTIMQ